MLFKHQWRRKTLFIYNNVRAYIDSDLQNTPIAWKNAIYIRKRFKLKANLCYLNTSGDEKRYLYTPRPKSYKNEGSIQTVKLDKTCKKTMPYINSDPKNTRLLHGKRYLYTKPVRIYKYIHCGFRHQCRRNQRFVLAAPRRNTPDFKNL